MNENDEYSDQHDLRRLAKDHQPPLDLEDRVVETLRSEGLVRAADRDAAGLSSRRWATAAGLLVAVMAGWFLRGAVAPAPSSTEPAREYLVLFAEPEPLETDKPIPVLVEEYRQWGTELGRAGHLVTGRRLLDTGRRLAVDESGALLSSAEDSLREATGFFLLRAESLQEAVDLVADSPHLTYGGELSVREVARDGSS